MHSDDVKYSDLTSALNLCSHHPVLIDSDFADQQTPDLLAGRALSHPSARDLRVVRAGGRPLVVSAFLVAAWYCSTTLAGIRPRSLTAMP
jgi:hypothetical protein